MVDYELNELKREFLDEARAKVEEMESVLEKRRDRESLDRLAYLAHQLKGSGGSYGYQRISADAAELEKAIESIVDPSSDGGSAPQAIQKHVVDLRGEIERATRELE